MGLVEVELAPSQHYFEKIAMLAKCFFSRRSKVYMRWYTRRCIKGKNGRYPTLSGGQKQRLALAIALMYDADVIIMDEPTSGLDEANMRRVSEVIEALAQKGHTMLVITHDVECAFACCERAIRIEQGKVTDDIKINDASELLELMGLENIEHALSVQ